MSNGALYLWGRRGLKGAKSCNEDITKVEIPLGHPIGDTEKAADT